MCCQSWQTNQKILSEVKQNLIKKLNGHFYNHKSML